MAKTTGRIIVTVSESSSNRVADIQKALASCGFEVEETVESVLIGKLINGEKDQLLSVDGVASVDDERMGYAEGFEDNPEFE